MQFCAQQILLIPGKELIHLRSARRCLPFFPENGVVGFRFGDIDLRHGAETFFGRIRENRRRYFCGINNHRFLMRSGSKEFQRGTVGDFHPGGILSGSAVQEFLHLGIDEIVVAFCSQEFHVSGGIISDGTIAKPAEDIPGNHEIGIDFPCRRRFSDYLSVVLIGPVLVFTAMGLTASITKSTLYQTLSHYPLLEWLFVAVSYILPYLLIIFAFTVLYIFIPNTKVRLRSALVGATVAGIIWQTVGWLFSSFVANANYTAIYSAFAALFFFMIWIYISWSILLTGASIAFYYQNPEYRLRSRRILTLSNRMKEKTAILVMSRVATNYYHQTIPPSLQDLARYLNLASESLMPIIATLEQANLLARTNADPARFLPGQAPEVLSVIEIIRAVRTADEDEIMNYSRLPDNDKVDNLLDAYLGAAQGALDAVTLKDLISPTEKMANKQQA